MRNLAGDCRWEIKNPARKTEIAKAIYGQLAMVGSDITQTHPGGRV